MLFIFFDYYLSERWTKILLPTLRQPTVRHQRQSRTTKLYALSRHWHRHRRVLSADISDIFIATPRPSPVCQRHTTMLAVLTLITMLTTHLSAIVLSTSISIGKAIDIQTVPIIGLVAIASFMDILRSLVVRSTPMGLLYAPTIDIDVTEQSPTVLTTKHTPAITTLVTTQSSPFAIKKTRRRRPVPKRHIVSGLPIIMAPTGGYNCTVM